MPEAGEFRTATRGWRGLLVGTALVAALPFIGAPGADPGTERSVATVTVVPGGQTRPAVTVPPTPVAATKSAPSLADAGAAPRRDMPASVEEDNAPPIVRTDNNEGIVFSDAQWAELRRDAVQVRAGA